MLQKTGISSAAQENLAQFLCSVRLGLVEDIGDADGASPRGQSVRVKARPLLSFKIDCSDVDVAGDADVDSTAHCVFKVGCSIWICEATLLQSKVADTEERFGVCLDALVWVQDITRSNDVRVFTDVRRRVHGIVDNPLDSEGIWEVDVSPEGDGSYMGLAEVRIENRPTCSQRNRSEPRGGRRSLGMRPGRHTEEAGETAD